MLAIEESRSWKLGWPCMSLQMYSTGPLCPVPLVSEALLLHLLLSALPHSLNHYYQLNVGARKIHTRC